MIKSYEPTNIKAPRFDKKLKSGDIISYFLSRFTPEVVEREVLSIYDNSLYEELGLTVEDGKQKLTQLFLNPKKWRRETKEKWPLKSNEDVVDLYVDVGEQDMEAIKGCLGKWLVHRIFTPDIDHIEDNVRIETWTDPDGLSVVMWGIIVD